MNQQAQITDVFPARSRYLGRSPANVRARLDALEFALEKAVRIPVIGRRVGLDGIAGLVPVAGDVLTGAMGLYMLWEARNIGLSRGAMARMAATVAFDTALGAVPVVGDVFDFAFRSNSRNLRRIRRELDRLHPPGLQAAR